MTDSANQQRPPAVSTADLEAAPRRSALGPGGVAQLAGWRLFFLVLSYVPLRGTDLWVHVNWGRWILEHRSLPMEDPFMPLAEGMAAVDAQWLSQVILAAVEGAGGGEWLSILFALTVLATYLLLARVCYLISGRASAATLGVLGALAVGWSRLTTPELFGQITR